MQQLSVLCLYVQIQPCTVLKFYQRGVEGYECFYNVYFSYRDAIFNVANQIGGIMKEIIGEIPDQKSIQRNVSRNKGRLC